MTATNGTETQSLRDRTHDWAKRLRVSPRVVRIQRMTRKWGSCSSSGTVTLASDLVEQDEAFQDFVVIHELLHLKIPNHGRVFKALLTIHVPNWRDLLHSSRSLSAPRHSGA